jgi:hypothetical protein
MGGLVLDIYAIYLIRVLIRAVRRLGSQNWPLITATVDGVCGDVDLHYKSVELLYVYELSGATFSGRSAKPFLWSESAKAYVTRFPEGSSLMVRVKPGFPEISVVRDSDQTISSESSEPTVAA